jgi:hypothetical protein
MRKIAILLVWLTLPGTMLAQRLTAHAALLDSVLVQPRAYAPLPRANDSFWRDSLPATLRQSYISYGERELEKPWPLLPLTAFADFKTNGNRTRYEGLCFERRRHLAVLVMAETVEGTGRFLSAIVDGLGALCEETWWGIPAHYKYKVPVSGEQTVDLFNAETAALVAWTLYLLQPQLSAFAPQLVSRLQSEIDRRLLRPVLKNDYWWKRAGMNWNPWICSNWLTCVLFCESDRGRQVQAVGQILQATDAFINAYKDDGGCDEGPGYWDRAAASMYEVLNTLRQATSGAIDLSHDKKVQAMGSYVYKTYIANDYCTTFADMHTNKAVMQPAVLYPMGCFLDDAVMRRMASYAARCQDYDHEGGRLFYESHNFPSLARELPFLVHYRQMQQEQAAEPLLRDVWLPDLQVMTARRGSLYVAMKGGHNGESHNHNDVGSFVVYADGQPLLIDPGTGEYTAKTFSKERYTIWTMQSAYHNLPQVNGVDQQDGDQYGARVVDYRPGRLTLDLVGAYPSQAALTRWHRSVALDRRRLTVTEDYQLAEWRSPVKLMLMTVVRPDVSRPGRVLLGSHAVSYDARQLEVGVDDLSPRLDNVQQHTWGTAMYRIVFTVKGDALRNRIQYTIQ